MAFSIPNGTTAAFQQQSELDTLDFRILGQSFSKTGVIRGLAITNPGATSVRVAEGMVMYQGDYIYCNGAISTITIHATLPRFVLIHVDTIGELSFRHGTPAEAPEYPTAPAGVTLAAIYVPGGATSITADNIIPKAPQLPPPSRLSTYVDTFTSGSSQTTQYNGTSMPLVIGNFNWELNTDTIGYNSATGLAQADTAIGLFMWTGAAAYARVDCPLIPTAAVNYMSFTVALVDQFNDTSLKIGLTQSAGSASVGDVGTSGLYIDVNLPTNGNLNVIASSKQGSSITSVPCGTFVNNQFKKFEFVSIVSAGNVIAYDVIVDDVRVGALSFNLPTTATAFFNIIARSDTFGNVTVANIQLNLFNKFSTGVRTS